MLDANESDEDESFLDGKADCSVIVIYMNPREIADLVHLRRARDLMGRAFAPFGQSRPDPAAALSGAATVIMTWEDFHCKLLA